MALALINALLDISKIEAGAVVLDLSTVAIDETIDACLALLRNIAIEAGVALIPPERTGCVLSADALRLKQVLINILSNGIKFTPRGGRVAVSAEAKGDQVEITVTDTGCGIAAKDIDRVVLPFVQVDSAFNRSHSGTGLGLPIAKQFCELHGGTLELSSEERRGTTVRISLPILSEKEMPKSAFG
jgi:two-component system cell cycle sensor histidine kinase PleC